MPTIPKIDWPKQWDAEEGWAKNVNRSKPLTQEKRGWVAFAATLREHHTSLGRIRAGLSGREVRDRIRLTQLKKEVRRLRITTAPQYLARYKEIPGAPGNPWTYYADSGWVSWLDLFGRKSRISLDLLKKEVRRLRIITWGKYQKRYKEIPGAPCDPPKIYTDWVSWPDLFGRAVVEFLPLPQLKKAVKDKKITSAGEYKKRYKEIPGAPADTHKVYADSGWVSWPDLFGTEKVWLPLPQLKKAVKDKKIISQGEYQKRYKEIPGAPSIPYKIYADSGWISWLDLFGREIADRVTLVQLKKEVKRLGITARREYQKRYKEIPGAPCEPDMVYAGWVSWDEFFGRPPYHRKRET